jgi:hypothetical protein
MHREAGTAMMKSVNRYRWVHPSGTIIGSYTMGPMHCSPSVSYRLKPSLTRANDATTEMNSGESEQRNLANVAANCCLHRDKPEWKALHLSPPNPDGQGLPLPSAPLAYSQQNVLSIRDHFEKASGP